MLSGHGGNLKEIIDKYKIREDRLIDFSSNINPLGITPGINRVISRGVNLLKRYPDPQCSLARQALAEYWAADEENFLLGNGSNELIHLLPRALVCQRVLTCQPDFSEYESSVKLCGGKACFLFSNEKEDFCIDIKKVIDYVPRVSLIIFSNPNNPTGYLLKKERILNLVKACEKNKTYLVIDEVFMDFVDEESKFSLLNKSVKRKYLLVLRSFTKFFCLPGLRAGYLVGAKETIKKISSFQPTWSVNSLAQEVAARGLRDSSFIARTKKYFKKERGLLFNSLKEIKGIRPYKPSANFIFCKILNGKVNSRELFLRLMKSGIVIRDCSNFRGLDASFFRVAVRTRNDNLYLAESLRRIFQ